MALIECKECGAMISDNAHACPYCGYPMHPKKYSTEATQTAAEEPATAPDPTPAPEPINAQEPTPESNQTATHPTTPEPEQPNVDKIETYLTFNADKLPASDIPMLKSMLLNLTPQKADLVMATTQFRDPVALLLFSIFLGQYGIDRFLLEEIGLGILKLITCGGCGIWAIVDWFLIMDKTRRYNAEKLLKNMR